MCKKQLKWTNTIIANTTLLFDCLLDTNFLFFCAPEHKCVNIITYQLLFTDGEYLCVGWHRAAWALIWSFENAVTE